MIIRAVTEIIKINVQDSIRVMLNTFELNKHFCVTDEERKKERKADESRRGCEKKK